MYKQNDYHMKHNRSSGIILHPTSFPGRYGIGDLGYSAYHWLDFLHNSGCGLWQLLPLGPTGYGDSPYQCFSAFAGNPYLISPDFLINDHLLKDEDFNDLPTFPDDQVDFGNVITWKIHILELAFERFQAGNHDLQADFAQFRKDQKFWLEDFALFMAIKTFHNGASWPNWNSDLRDRHPFALSEFISKNQIPIEQQVFRQFLFNRQWSKLRSYAHSKGIKLIGDAPIFVAHDSADVWSHPELFYLDPLGNPTVVAGVPPDYFSVTGQLWGNPLYRWSIHQQTGYSWWLARIQKVLSFVDIIRLDHFRGFAGYWEIPAGLPTAEHGRWVKGPGVDFFQKMKTVLGDLPIIAEDLGEITPDVVELRDSFGLPGMKILQFGFASDSNDPFLPHNYTRNFVAYTGTHDNDTTLGWFRNVPQNETEHAIKYLGLQKRSSEKQFVSSMIRWLWSSVAMFSLAPIQDFLDLDSTARMNYPGRPSGNWSWRLTDHALTTQLSKRILMLNQLYGRVNTNKE